MQHGNKTRRQTFHTQRSKSSLPEHVQTDLGKRKVTESEGRLWAETKGYLYFETSAQSGEGVVEMFQVCTCTCSVTFKWSCVSLLSRPLPFVSCVHGKGLVMRACTCNTLIWGRPGYKAGPVYCNCSVTPSGPHALTQDRVNEIIIHLRRCRTH